MIGSMMMCLSVVVLLVGMLAGIAMGIQQNFMLAPAHSHLNLIGGVLLFLFGLYYRLVPAAGTTRLAQVQGWLHMVGAIVFPRHRRRAAEGPLARSHADCGIADRRRGDVAVRVIVFRTRGPDRHQLCFGFAGAHRRRGRDLAALPPVTF